MCFFFSYFDVYNFFFNLKMVFIFFLMRDKSWYSRNLKRKKNNKEFLLFKKKIYIKESIREIEFFKFYIFMYINKLWKINIIGGIFL